MTTRRFRFAFATNGGNRSDVLEQIRRAESAGYDTIVCGDHLLKVADPLTTLMFVADHTETMRICTWVACNDFRHPVVLARSLANLDELSGGRLDIGLGAGYLVVEYESAGIALEPGRRRLARLREATTIVKAMMERSPVDFHGQEYRLSQQVSFPLARQQPCPPLLLGGGGPKMLAWAATEADIVSIIPQSGPAGNLLLSTTAASAARARVNIVRAAAGGRFDALTLNTLLLHAEVTTDRRAAAERWLDGVRSGSAAFAGAFTFDADIGVDELLESPYFAFGTVMEIADHLRRCRETMEFSYWVVYPHVFDTVAPVLELLLAE
jgi:probable F420-dependent oxidoreductase